MDQKSPNLVCFPHGRACASTCRHPPGLPFGPVPATHCAARAPHALLFVALALSLLPGCAWLKGQTASKVPTDPERKAIAESQPGKKIAAPIGLDGSATDNGAAAIPNAPGLNGAQVLATGHATADPAAGPSSTSDKNDPNGTAVSRSGGDPVVVAGGAIAEESKVVTAADRGDEDQSRDERGGNEPAQVQPQISPADEALTNENSVLEFEGAGVKLKNGEVAAIVNGQPVFVEDIMKQIPVEHANFLARAQREAPPEQYRKLRQEAVKMHLDERVDRELLLQALKAKIKEDQLKLIVKHIDKLFNDEGLPHAMKIAGVQTEAEFEAALRKNGSSIEVLRSEFRNKELARQYIGAHALPKSGFDRPEVLKYYQDHKEDYAIPARAKWEQIRLLFSKNGGKPGAEKKAAEVLERLDNGEDFAAIARECSDGPTAESRGGMRPWITQGTLKDKEIEQAVFEQPVGQIGPIETDEAIEIVRVVDRTAADYQPFPAVQDDIKAQLKNTLMQKATKDLINDLRDKATIETFTDKL